MVLRSSVANMDETQQTAEFNRIWTALSPAVRTLLMADPDKQLSPGEVVLVTGSGKIPVVMSDAYWVLNDEGPSGFHLSESFQAFVIDKRTAPPAG